MLDFFRRYQRYFFIGITFVIAISFSFFGTGPAVQPVQENTKIAFTAVDGSTVSQADVNQMRWLLSLDANERDISRLYRPSFFLSNTLFQKEILETGIGELLAEQFAPSMADELREKQLKERKYKPYVHPQANFISMIDMWSNFSPLIKGKFRSLQEAEDPTTREAIAIRKDLYLEEKQFPSEEIRQMLKNQERHFSWIPADAALDQVDLALFGYHTPEEWFGKRFLEITAEFILNSAKIAEERGYRVSKGEALADLYRQISLSFYKLQQYGSPYLTVANAEEYFEQQLRYSGLDTAKAVKMWQNVLLFRRLFQDAGDSLFVDHLGLEKFANFAEESIRGELYHIADGLHLGSFSDLQKFEVYLSAIAPRDKNDRLSLPETFFPIEKVMEKNPELVQKRYVLEISSTNENFLLGKIGLKEMWSWEGEEVNWKVLQSEFPELALKKAETKQERMAALNALDRKTRTAADAFARKEMLKNNRELIVKVLREETPETRVVGITYKGTGSPVVGLKEGSSLISLLDEAPLGVETEKLTAYTADGKHYYSIKVIERAANPEILSFKEANRNKTLDALLKKKLHSLYQKQKKTTAKEESAKEKLLSDTFSEARESLAVRYFGKVLKAIKEEEGEEISETDAASLRFSAYLKKIRNILLEDPAQKEKYVKQEKAAESEQLGQPQTPAAQWKLEMTPFRLVKKEKREKIDPQEAFDLKPEEWSPVHTTATGEAFFYQKISQTMPENVNAFVAAGTNKERQLGSNAIQLRLAEKLLHRFQEKKAFSNPALESEESSLSHE